MQVILTHEGKGEIFNGIGAIWEESTVVTKNSTWMFFTLHDNTGSGICDLLGVCVDSDGA